MDWYRYPRGDRAILLLLVGVALVGAVPQPAPRGAAPPAHGDGAQRDEAAKAEAVLVSLRRSIAWYQAARGTMQGIRGAIDGSFDRAEEQTAQRVVQRAFEAAGARAAVLDADQPAGDTDASARPTRSARRAQLAAVIAHEQREVERITARLRAAPAAARPALERELAMARSRLELGQLQAEFLTQRDRIDSTAPGEDAELRDYIQILRDTLPELGSAGEAPAAAPAAEAAQSRGVGPSGAWRLTYRLLALQRNRSALKELGRATDELDREVRAEIQTTRETVRPMMARLRELTGPAAGDGPGVEERREEFRRLVGRTRLLGTVLLPLREQSALLRRYVSDVDAWGRTLDRETGQALRGLAVEFVGIVIALGAIFLAAVLWRIAVVRYVSNDYHRRLLLTTRHVVLVVAVVMVLVFHFASELTALVAVLGFAAAGVAFALQNVILAVAGYFSMVAPNGIRVGDRVSLQGPFGYVHGEVIEIGVVRTRLRELTGDPLQPTGRIMVFPNSVAFTGSFIKHPPSESRRESRAA